MSYLNDQSSSSRVFDVENDNTQPYGCASLIAHASEGAGFAIHFWFYCHFDKQPTRNAILGGLSPRALQVDEIGLVLDLG